MNTVRPDCFEFMSVCIVLLFSNKDVAVETYFLLLQATVL